MMQTVEIGLRIVNFIKGLFEDLTGIRLTATIFPEVGNYSRELGSSSHLIRPDALRVFCNIKPSTI